MLAKRRICVHLVISRLSKVDEVKKLITVFYYFIYYIYLKYDAVTQIFTLATISNCLHIDKTKFKRKLLLLKCHKRKQFKLMKFRKCVLAISDISFHFHPTFACCLLTLCLGIRWAERASPHTHLQTDKCEF